MRLTRQRQILLDLIDKTGQHLDAESLYQLAREKDPKLNRVTVYRTLKLLKEGGLVDELDLMHQAGEQHYYETRRKQEHAHIICLSCGKVEEFFGEPLQKLRRRKVETDFGFQIVLARTEVKRRLLPALSDNTGQRDGTGCGQRRFDEPDADGDRRDKRCSAKAKKRGLPNERPAIKSAG